MTNYNEHLQRLYHQYETEHDGAPAAPRAVVEWAMARGLLAPHPVDPVGLLSRDMAKALREEYRTDASGRRYRVNHSVTITSGGVQTAFWGELDRAPRAHMAKAFAQRRKQIVGDCAQLKTDVDVYNGKHADEPVLQLILDFTDDVAELEAAARARGTAA